jgi:enoyl-[acyl-carrier protein] reductase III
MTDVFSLSGRRILVTGGTRGIGRSISLGCARAGARVVANYVRNTSAAEDLERCARDDGLDLTVLRADITSPKGIGRVREELSADDGLVPCLVHCAATGVHRPLEQLDVRHFDWTMSLNVRAFFELLVGMTPVLRPGSAIVVLSSAGALRAVPQYALVGTSKGALESLARHAAAELAPRGVRVNILSPGSVLTDAWSALPDKERRLGEAVARTPAGRLTEPEAVAHAAQFLLSDAASGIVGHTLVVDGGHRIVE